MYILYGIPLIINIKDNAIVHVFIIMHGYDGLAGGRAEEMVFIVSG